MCTWSVISSAQGCGFRVMMNRDEERTRPLAQPPRWHELDGGGRAIWPVDPNGPGGGGTWFAANERGLVCALLNGNPASPPPRPACEVSRGVLIPSLMHMSSAAGVVSALRARDLSAHRPFRLVAVDPSGGEGEPGAVRVHDLVWTGRGVAVGERLCRAACFTSSGLGDELVVGRLALFDEMVGRPAAGTATAVRELHAAQEAFHGHGWHGRGEVSVMMSRADARTVSVASVTVYPDGGGPVEMSYRAVADGI